MKITKRQLKRIIREEYSKLKRRGLIRENVGGAPEGEWYIADIGFEQMAFHESVVDNPSDGSLTPVGSKAEALAVVIGPDYLFYPHSHREYSRHPDDASFVWSNLEEIITGGYNFLTVEYSNYIEDTFSELAFESDVYR